MQVVTAQSFVLSNIITIPRGSGEPIMDQIWMGYNGYPVPIAYEAFNPIHVAKESSGAAHEDTPSFIDEHIARLLKFQPSQGPSMSLDHRVKITARLLHKIHHTLLSFSLRAWPLNPSPNITIRPSTRGTVSVLATRAVSDYYTTATERRSKSKPRIRVSSHRRQCQQGVCSCQIEKELFEQKSSNNRFEKEHAAEIEGFVR